MKITRDMLDYDDDAVIVTVNDRRYRVTTEFDADAAPTDYECYNAEDIDRWHNDDWNYVGVIVTPLDVPSEDQQFELSDSLWGVEYGFPLNPPLEHDGIRMFYTGMDYMVLVHPVPYMIEGVIASEKTWYLKQATQSYCFS
jgi:hypothetical protein